MIQKRKQPHFLSAVVFILGLALINLLIIGINSFAHSKGITFFGNVVGIGLLFPASLLYVERKEKFNFKRYLFLSIQTMIAIGIVMYLFVLRF